jgi:hypothetical protein
MVNDNIKIWPSTLSCGVCKQCAGSPKKACELARRPIAQDTPQRICMPLFMQHKRITFLCTKTPDYAIIVVKRFITNRQIFSVCTLRENSKAGCKPGEGKEGDDTHSKQQAKSLPLVIQDCGTAGCALELYSQLASLRHVHLNACQLTIQRCVRLRRIYPELKLILYG